MKSLIIRSLIITLFLFVSWEIKATHLRAAEITIERACNSLSVTIRLRVYLNTGSPSQFGAGVSYINWGDGTPDLNIPTIPSTPRPDLGPNIGVAEFTTTHTYSASGVFKITYVERDRSSNVINIPGSDDVAYATSTTINLSDAIGCNNYPALTISPVDRACLGRTFTHSSGAVDPEGDSLSYELVVPAQNETSPVDVYLSPDDPTFYTNYPTANESGTGPPSITIDPITGIITWDAPGLIAEFNIAFKVTEWRKDPVTDEFVMLSATVRDMQIIVEDCDNERPDITVPADLCVAAGTSVSRIITGTDPDLDPVKIEPFSEIFTLPNPATYSPFPAVFTSSDPNAQQTFEWNTDCSHVRDQPYQVVYRISDQPPASQTPLVTFKTWSIKVLADAPTWVTADIDLVNRHGLLSWDNSSCATADRIQIWRKVGGFNFVPPPCATGLPAYLGYQLVAEVGPSTNSFIDTGNNRGLAAGAYYCYRLVAVFDDPIAKSPASSEICIGPIRADAPILTHATVEKTGITDGSVRVSWRSPFDMDATQFPKPYTYEVYRGELLESDDDSQLVKVSSQISDTTFLDTGIDTDGKAYHYKVVVYSRTQFSPTIIPVDTSSAASTVRLEAVSDENTITLNWNAAVPWSNIADANPVHDVYRGTSENNLTLIASVNVTSGGFTYEDSGLDINQKYYYKVMTRGTYGNPKINGVNGTQLQENYSQILGVYPENELPVCSTEGALEIFDCEAYLSQETCVPMEFINTIYWKPVEDQPGCRTDIIGYNIYVSEGDIEGDYQLLASNVRDTLYQEEELESLARCYRIAAVSLIDGEEVESEWSGPVCSDNCPYYELPNVFTPGNADGLECNDYFRPYFDPAANDNCPIVDVDKCPRFVKSVRITIFNRWGKEVYYYNSESPNHSIYINWDGRDSDGTILESGMYYYVADVTFDALDPTKKNSTIKGWVNLLR